MKSMNARSGIPPLLAAGPGFSADKTKGHFPVSVWYAGGKARVPMLEAVITGSRAVWRKDLEQIKSLGFNTVRPWIEWTACEKEEGKYDFSALRTVCDLANEIGPSIQARFREWLMKKYGTLEALNKAWYRTLTSWDVGWFALDPPRPRDSDRDCSFPC